MIDRDKQPTPTVPASISVRLEGASEAELNELWGKMAVCVGAISERIDLATLDGITVSADYVRALANLDRGVDVLENDNRLMPTRDTNSVGVAMTPTLLKGGSLKSHMVFEYNHICGIGRNTDSREYRAAFHTLAHECAHVEASSKFDAAFPGVLLHRCPDLWSALDEAKWKYATDPCWQEYVVCRRVSEFAGDAVEGYIHVLLNIARDAEDEADRMFEECLEDRDYGKVFYGLFGLYGKVMKYSCYVLGTVHGLGLGIEDVPKLDRALADSWFRTYLDRLGECGKALYASYGTWRDYQTFEAFGDLLEEIVAKKGVRAVPHRHEYLYVTLDGIR